jgi:hypothetical protein
MHAPLQINPRVALIDLRVMLTFGEKIYMDSITITAIVSVALTITVPMLRRLPSERKRFQKMDDRKLIDTRVTARMMQKAMIAIGVIGPIPFILMISTIKKSSIVEVMMCGMIAVASCGTIGFWSYFEQVRLATAELEYRKFQKEKNNSEQIDGSDS